MRLLRLVLRYTRLSTEDLIQFPFGVAMKVVDIGFRVLFLYAFWYSVTSFGIAIPGWSQPEVLVLGGMGLVGGSICQLGFGFRDIAYAVVDGTLDVYLTRPVHPLFTVLAEKLGIFWVTSQFVSGLALVLIAARMGNLQLVNCVPSLLVLVTGCVAYQTMYGCLSLTSFWQGRVSSIRDTFFSVASARTYPIDVLPKSLGFALTWVIPIGLVATMPARILLGKVLNPWPVVSLSGLLAVGWVAVLSWLWEKALSGYESTGT
jgi:ABC-type uncharacterized transport system permease subunit